MGAVYDPEPVMPTIDKIAAALAKAQPTFKPLIKDKLAVINSAKASYKYKYADLASVFDSIRESLATNEIAIVQTTTPAESGYLLTTRLIHSSGQSIDSTLRLDKWPDPKQFGIEMSYMRRYALCALVGIASDDDTDGDGADSGPRGNATKKDADPPANARRGLEENILQNALEDIKEADTAEELRTRYSKAYRLALDAGDNAAQSKLLAEYRAHKLYVAPVTTKGAVS